MKLLNSKTALKKYLEDKGTKHQAIMVEDPGRESLCRSLMIMAHRFLLILNRKAMVELQQDAKLVSWTAVRTIILQMKNVLIGCLV